MEYKKQMTPVMGWSSWNLYGVEVNEEGVMKQMHALVDKGLKDAGYEFINIDDCWQKGRDPITGRVNYSKQRFPHGMKYIADEAHRLGLKAGIYTDGGDHACASSEGGRAYGRNVGLWNHEEDLWMYLSDGIYMDKYSEKTPTDGGVECWGYDFIKVDWCGGRNHSLDPEERYSEYDRIINEIEEANGKDKIFNICCWGYYGPWMLRVGDYWRCGVDLDMTGRNFGSVIGAFDAMKRLGRLSLPGHYADPDMLVVGKGLSEAEDRSHFAMWCMFSVPLVLGCDIAQMKDETVELVTNRELIELNNDPLAKCATCIKTFDNGVELWFKKTVTYEGGDGAIALFNRSDEEQTVTLNMNEVACSGRAQVRDIINHQELGELADITVTLPKHDIAVMRIKTFEGFTKEDFAVSSEDEIFPNSGHQQNWPGITAKEFVERYDAMLIDVRTPEEFAQGHIEGAVNIEYNKLIYSTDKLPKDDMARIIVYCSGDKRSRQAHTELRKMKYKNVYNMGAMENWGVEKEDR